MSKPENPQAFPYSPCTGNAGDDVEGMTLRDYFAAKAMEAFLSQPNTWTRNGIAQAAYEFADAMLKARSNDA